jgi:hypothetical protein
VSRAPRISAICALFVLVAVGLITSSDTRHLSETSYGAVPAGHGVLYDLLEELGIPLSRSFASASRLPERETVWWIEPPRLALVAPPPEADAEQPERREPPRWLERMHPKSSELSGDALGEWIAAGGTAVVFLDSSAQREELQLAGFAVPAREELAPPAGGGEAADAREEGAPVDASASDAEEEHGAKRDPFAAPRSFTVLGAPLRAPRRLALPWPVAFTGEGEGWSVVARAEGAPFALERARGGGRLVVVADASFLWNRWLPRADAAPLALDFVRAYGVPRIDERAHGLSGSRGVVRTLAASAAAPFLAGLALFGVLFAWFGGALPRRVVGDAEPPAPTLDTYVASMAGYYGASREYPRVFERYRELSARRLRRALALAPDAPLAHVIQRAQHLRRADEGALELLAGRAPVRDARGLARAVRKLDELVRRVAG